MKIVGVAGLLLAIFLILWNFAHISLWSVGIGLVLGSSCCILFFLFNPEKPLVPDTTVDQQWKVRLELLESEMVERGENLQKEIEKLQQKLIRADERCLSYQNLVNVHQEEINKVVGEKKVLVEDLIAKDRKLSEALLARLEPELFDLEKLQMEAELRELKMKFLDAPTI